MRRVLTDDELLDLMGTNDQRINRAGRKRMLNEDYKAGYKAGYFAGRFGRKADVTSVLQSQKGQEAPREGE